MIQYLDDIGGEGAREPIRLGGQHGKNFKKDTEFQASEV